MNLEPRYRRYLDCDGHAQDLLARGSVSVPTPNVHVFSLRYMDVEDGFYHYWTRVNGAYVFFKTAVDLGMPAGNAWRRVVIDVVVTPGRCMEDDSVVLLQVLAVQENAGCLGLVDTIPEASKDGEPTGRPP